MPSSDREAPKRCGVEGTHQEPNTEMLDLAVGIRPRWDFRGVSRREIRTRRAQCYLSTQADPLMALILSRVFPSQP
jgi:hypothetical protein